MSNLHENRASCDNLKILVVDDERLSSHNLTVQLKFIGEQPVVANSESWFALSQSIASQTGLLTIVVGLIRNTSPEKILLDIVREHPDIDVIFVAQADQQTLSLDAAVQDKLQILDANNLDYHQLSAALQKARLRKGLGPKAHSSRIMSDTGSVLFRSLSGNSRVIEFVRHQIKQVSTRDVTVMILGESGAGKEVVARNLHYHSGRGDAPFVAVNCAAIMPDNNGVELFGHAEVDAQGRARSGFLELAEGGTLYLDEVNALPLKIQVLLLRFLEDKVYHHNGGGNLKKADVRVVAGSVFSLQTLVEQGRFRKDLYYRLNLLPIQLPPLRKRLEDIPDLVRELLQCLKSKDYQLVSLNSSAIEALAKHQWPGNVRELANLIERLCIMHPGEVIGVSNLPLEYQQAEDTEALLQEIEALTGKVESRASQRKQQSSDVVSATETAHAGMHGQVLSVTDHSGGAAAVGSDDNVHPAGPPAAIAETSDLVPAQEVASANTAPETAELCASPAESLPPMESSFFPLNDSSLKNYLHNFEKQLYKKALDDCANILSFAAERLQIDESELTEKIQTLQLQGF